MVDVNVVGVQVPMEYAHDGQIVLKYFSFAVSHLELMPHQVLFSASFGGVPRKSARTYGGCNSIYARENGVRVCLSQSQPMRKVIIHHH